MIVLPLLWLCICLLCAVLSLSIVGSARNRIVNSLRQSPESRGLFSFHDGYRIRTVDPIDVLSAMEGHKEYRFDLHPQRVLDGEKEAMNITVDAVRQAFGIPPFTAVGKPGLTQQECLRLLNAFIVYIASQKKSTEPIATSSPSTAATSES